MFTFTKSGHEITQYVRRLLTKYLKFCIVFLNIMTQGIGDHRLWRSRRYKYHLCHQTWCRSFWNIEIHVLFVAKWHKIHIKVKNTHRWRTALTWPKANTHKVHDMTFYTPCLISTQANILLILILVICDRKVAIYALFACTLNMIICNFTFKEKV